MTLQALKSRGVLNSEQIADINDRVHEISNYVAMVNDGLFYHGYRFSGSDHIYFQAGRSDWRGVNKQEHGISIINGGSGLWLKMTMSHPDACINDGTPTRRISALKRTAAVIFAEGQQPRHWTDALIDRPEYHQTLLTILKSALETARALSTNYPKGRF